MNILITGASGFLGGNLAKALISKGHTVTCIVRNPDQFDLSGRKGVKIIKGDITDDDISDKVTDQYDILFHVAAFAKAWSEDPDLPYKVNVKGTLNMLEIAARSGVRKFIYTSTAGVFGFSEKSTMLSEKTPYISDSGLAYIDTKILAEKSVLGFSGEGMDCIIVNPTRIYGPGPINESNSITRIISGYISGKWRIIPGDGTSIGNYVFIDDVINGHILAMLKGKHAENYLLGGENIDYNTMFFTLGRLSGNKRFMIKFPKGLMLFTGSLMESYSRITKTRPLISRRWAERFLKHMNVDTGKAKRELGYEPLSFEEGAARTIKWLQSDG